MVDYPDFDPTEHNTHRPNSTQHPRSDIETPLIQHNIEYNSLPGRINNTPTPTTPVNYTAHNQLHQNTNQHYNAPALPQQHAYYKQQQHTYNNPQPQYMPQPVYVNNGYVNGPIMQPQHAPGFATGNGFSNQPLTQLNAPRPNTQLRPANAHRASFYAVCPHCNRQGYTHVTVSQDPGATSHLCCLLIVFIILFPLLPFFLLYALCVCCTSRNVIAHNCRTCGWQIK